MEHDDRDRQALLRRLSEELIDGYDEELHLEIEDHSAEDVLAAEAGDDPRRAERLLYFRELFRLQRELVRLQDWIQHTGQKVVILFEGRDAAGKGGAIKRITQRLNPRVCRTVALPAAGEMVLFDRSWYNRAGVERVMGFCTEDEVEEFFRSVPEFERMLVRSGIRLSKYWC